MCIEKEPKQRTKVKRWLTVNARIHHLHGAKPIVSSSLLLYNPKCRALCDSVAVFNDQQSMLQTRQQFNQFNRTIAVLAAAPSIGACSKTVGWRAGLDVGR